MKHTSKPVLGFFLQSNVSNAGTNQAESKPSELQLHRRANALFPRAAYLDESTVRANRQKYKAAVAYLRSGAQSKWILDRAGKQWAA